MQTNIMDAKQNPRNTSLTQHKRKRYLKAVFKNHIKNNCMNGNEEEKDE